MKKEETMDCKKIGDLLTAYLDSEVKHGEREQIQAHLSTCLHCQEEFKSLISVHENLRKTLGELGTSATPSPQAWVALQQKLHTMSETQGKWFWGRVGQLMPRQLVWQVVTALLVTILVASGITWGTGVFRESTSPPTMALIDDWQYDLTVGQGGTLPGSTPTLTPVGVSGSAFSIFSMGLATGGAKDINNFRENIENDYLPLPTDITYEGLFYDYYFDTGQKEECQELFCPSYSYAVTRDPFSGEEEYYLSVGLNSGIKESDFQREKLNLVVVLDVSDSMNSPFKRYYYDQFGNIEESSDEAEDYSKPKIEIAKEAVVALIDNLENEDRFGMVLFNNDAFLAKPLNLVGNTDIEAIKDHILKISATGSTRLSAGMQMATGLFDEMLEVDQAEYDNRIIFLSDAMPNLGETSEYGLLAMTKKNSNNKIHTTFIGIGVDFNSELVEYIMKVRGANYYSVHSASQFKERMDDEFEYMVTPLVFDVQLNLEAEGWKIEKVYGSPEANEATGELMRVSTLFPSKREGGETKGGIVLLKMRKTSSENGLRLKLSYENRDGKTYSVETAFEMEWRSPEFFDNNGIRKGVLLSRYADLLKNWITDEREHAHISYPWDPSVDREEGIIVPPPIQPSLGKWERQSIPLVVSDPYKELFEDFGNYFEEEVNIIGDDTLGQELEVLRTLSGYNRG